MHKLLIRQLKRLKLQDSGDIQIEAEIWESFLAAISESYQQADKDKYIVEYSLKLASDELTQRNRELRKNVSELTDNQAIISFQANHDALTQLPNRSFFMNRLKQALIENGTIKQFALLFIDLDNFKEVNDNYGHQIGDELLCIVSKRLLSCLRDQDLLSRIGGDEFLLLIENINDLSFVKKVGDRLLQEIAKPCHFGEKQLTTSASIGVSIFPNDGRDIDTLICNADLAMYKAKQSGKNSLSYFS